MNIPSITTKDKTSSTLLSKSLNDTKVSIIYYLNPKSRFKRFRIGVQESKYGVMVYQNSELSLWHRKGTPILLPLHKILLCLYKSGWKYLESKISVTRNSYCVTKFFYDGKDRPLLRSFFLKRRNNIDVLQSKVRDMNPLCLSRIWGRSFLST